MVRLSGLPGLMTPGLYGAASFQTGSKCVEHGNSHHSAAQTPSTSGSATQNTHEQINSDLEVRYFKQGLYFSGRNS